MNTTRNELAAPEVSTDALPVLEWEGVRVVTTETLAKGYGTDAANLRKNFERNIKRFVDGVHVFHLTGSKLREFKNYATESHVVDCNNIKTSSVVNKHAKHFTLWTEKGAARMSKIVDTDQAWEFFEKLEDAYFRPRQPVESAPCDLANAFIELQQRQIALYEELMVNLHRNCALQIENAQLKSQQQISHNPFSLTDQQLLQERDELTELLGRSRNYATIDSVERKLEREFGWHRLRNWCLMNHVKPLVLRKFQCVNAWPRGAWLEVYGINLEELFG